MNKQHENNQGAKTGQSSIEQVGAFYQLHAGDDLKQSPLYNDDIAPTAISARNWSAFNVASLWVGMAICVPTYTLGGVLTAYFGLSVSEALFTILIANVIILIPLILNAFPGTRFGIPFPVLLRSSFGVYGSNIPCLIRALVACGWFGIQSLFGGIALHLLFSTFSASWQALGSVGEVYGFFIFLALNLTVVIKGSNAIRLLETLAAPLLLLVALGLMIWAAPQIDVSALLAKPANRPENAPLAGYFMAGLTAMVGFWATLSLNIPDFSRYAKSQRTQIVGQIAGLPLTMLFFASLGVVLTAASPDLVGESISDPINLIGKINQPLWVALAMVFIVIATISTNTAANIVSPTNDFQNVAPKYISEKRGVLLTGLIGTALMAWELLVKLGWVTSEQSLSSLYANWLLGYSSLLGPIAGIMVVDYFIVKKQQLNLIDLYRVNGIYGAFHWPGLMAFFIPVLLTLWSISTDSLHWFYDYGWFTGSFMGAALYFVLSRLKDPYPESTDWQTSTIPCNTKSGTY